MPSPAKQKGSGYERACAQFLTDLYNESFTRVPNSGAFIGGKNSTRKDFLSESQIRSFKGDIIPGDSFPRLVIECKFYADFPFHQLFTGSVKILDTWLAQIMQTSDPQDINLLLLKFNRKGQFVAVPYTMPGLTVENHLVYDSSAHGSWVIMEHATFWRLNSELIRQLSK